MWLLLTGKHLCWSLFLILSITKFLRAHILKNICKRLILKMCLWELFIKRFDFTLKKQRFFSTSISETSENVCFYFIIGFPWSLYSFTCNISLAWWEINSTKYLLELIKRGSKVQETWEHALNFDQWKTFSEN